MYYFDDMNIHLHTKNLLTPREESVFQLLLEGKLIKDIARCLGITPKSTYRHVEHGKNKLHAETLPHAVSLLWAQGHVKTIASLFLGLCLWLPLADNFNAENTAIARRGAGGKARRTGRSKTEHGQFTFDPDTGQLQWPEDEQEQAA